jgi:hypothetical protein
MNHLNLRLQDVDNRIRSLLDSTRSARWNLFTCTHTILYLPDHYSNLLEPIFMLPQVGYGALEPLPVSAAAPSQVDTFLATIAFTSRAPEFSCDPWKDGRLSQSALKLIGLYDIRGAVIAFPLCLRSDYAPLGVWIICANTILHPPGEELNRRITDEFRDMVIRLTYLLGLREAILATEVSTKYERLSYELFAQLRPISTLVETASKFRESCRDLLRAEYVLLDIVFPDKPHHSVEDDSLSSVRLSLKADAPIVVNRSHIAPALYETLAKRFTPTKRLAWAGLQVADRGAKVTCFVARCVDTLADHWTTHEVNLLHTSLRFLQLALKRTNDFDQLITQLTTIPALARTNRSFSESVFDSAYDICKDHLGIDQLLVTSVRREATHLFVEGVWAKGFGDKDEFIREQTRRTLFRPNGTGMQPDILTFVLDDCLNTRDAVEPRCSRSKLYQARVGEPSPVFRLDDTVVAECALKGPIYFLPCFSDSGDGEPVLRSIIHLGQAAGNLRLGEEAEPVLHVLSRTVADALARDEEERMRRRLESIYAHKDLTPLDLHHIAVNVSLLCSSLGSALFLNARLLPLVGCCAIEEGDVVEAFRRLFNVLNAAGWDILTLPKKEKLQAMIAAYLGIDAGHVPLVVRSGAHHLASLLGTCLYVCVARTDREEPSNDLEDLLRLAQKDPDDRQYADAFVGFLTGQCYLPGYGLTGWCVRYQRAMCLPNKSQEQVLAFFNAVKDQLEVPQPTAIVETLRFLQPPVESQLAANPIQTPAHADHIRDCPHRSQREDAFLAVPLESMDDGVTASGVLRTSTSVTLRSSFEKAAEKAVTLVAQHLSLLLRGEKMRQQSFVQKYSDFEQLRKYLYHKLKRFTDALKHVEDACLPLSDSAIPTKIRDHIDELKAICGHVVRSRKHDKLLHYLRGKKADRLPVGPLAEILRDFIESPCCASQVVVKMARDVVTSESPITHKDQVLPLCLLIDEVLTNSARYSRPEEIVILLYGRDAVAVQVVEGGKGLSKELEEPVQVEPNERSPYPTILGPREGEGGEMIRQLALETRVHVTWAEYRTGFKVYMLEPKAAELIQRPQEAGYAQI